MPVSSPVTTNTFGRLSYVVLTAKPVDLTKVTLAEITAGENVSCHTVGEWWPTASVEKVSRQRKACQTSVPQANGAVTHELPTLTSVYMPQEVGTPGAPGNEAYDALPPGADVFVLMRIGPDGKSDWAAGDKYRLFAANVATRTPATSADDAGGEAVFLSELAFSAGYTEPIEGVVTA